MRKIIVVIMFVMSTFLLSSCISEGGNKVIVDNSRSRADERIEEIVEAIKNKDKDGLVEMFSEKALNEADDVQENIDYLFDYIQGDVREMERIRFSGNSSLDDGKKSESLVSWYTIDTDQESYMFL